MEAHPCGTTTKTVLNFKDHTITVSAAILLRLVTSFLFRIIPNYDLIFLFNPSFSFDHSIQHSIFLVSLLVSDILFHYNLSNLLPTVTFAQTVLHPLSIFCFASQDPNLMSLSLLFHGLSLGVSLRSLLFSTIAVCLKPIFLPFLFFFPKKQAITSVTLVLVLLPLSFFFGYYHYPSSLQYSLNIYWYPFRMMASSMLYIRFGPFLLPFLSISWLSQINHSRSRVIKLSLSACLVFLLSSESTLVLILPAFLVVSRTVSFNSLHQLALNLSFTLFALFFILFCNFRVNVNYFWFAQIGFFLTVLKILVQPLLNTSKTPVRSKQ
ncbi:hypothetical protein GEMRC1_012894 [Eukaryota sp. GEM-RC1]